MSISDKIITLREKKGWTQAELADKLGYHRPHVNRWETGKYSPSLEALKKLSKLFKVPIDYLVFDEKKPKKT